MADEGDRSKADTKQLVLAPGDRVIIANQLDTLRATFEEAKSNRAADVESFYRDHWNPFRAELNARVDRANTRSLIAIGMALATLTLGAIRLYLASK